MNEYLVAVIFFAIAVLYSSIGFGGGSSYLAILSLLLTDFFEIRSMALVLNIVVVSIGTIMYIRHKQFSWKQFSPFVILSVPAAYIGANLRLTEKTFFLILGSALMLSALAMLYQQFLKKASEKKLPTGTRAGIGFSIGFLSGVAGIGGGIFLSPTLHIFKWANAKTIAALASFFILVNSIAGLAGVWIADSFRMDWSFSAKIIGAVFLGGIVGSLLSNRKMEFKHIRTLTAVLVGYVGIRILLLHLADIRI